MLNVVMETVVNKVEKQLVVDHLQQLKETYELGSISLADRYNDMKKFKLSSNTTVVCLSCLSLRHKKGKEMCCDKSPNYDLTTSYRIILDFLQGEQNGNK